MLELYYFSRFVYFYLFVFLCLPGLILCYSMHTKIFMQAFLVVNEVVLKFIYQFHPSSISINPVLGHGGLGANPRPKAEEHPESDATSQVCLINNFPMSNEASYIIWGKQLVSVHLYIGWLAINPFQSCFLDNSHPTNRYHFYNSWMTDLWSLMRHRPRQRSFLRLHSTLKISIFVVPCYWNAIKTRIDQLTVISF